MKKQTIASWRAEVANLAGNRLFGRTTENPAYYWYVFLEVLSTTSGYFYKKKIETKQKNFTAFKFSAYQLHILCTLQLEILKGLCHGSPVQFV